MAKYLIEASYTADGVKGLLKDGGSARREAATQLMETLGGKVEAFYFSFGSSDAYVILDMPDNVSLAAAVLAVNYCQSAFVGNIVEGHFNDTPLAGLNWAGLYKWPGEIAEGNGKSQIVIDERADEAQRVALETIISGGACEPLSNLFSVFASTCSEFCETLFLPKGVSISLS